METFLDIGEKKEIDESSGPSGGASPGGEVERPGEFQRLFRRVHPGRKGNIVFNGGILLDAAGNLLGESWRQGRACTMEAKAFWSTRRTKVFADTPPTGGGYGDTIHNY